jgi:hypothetical protein
MKYNICKYKDENHHIWYEINRQWLCFTWWYYNWEGFYCWTLFKHATVRFSSKEEAELSIGDFIRKDKSQRIKFLGCEVYGE